MFERLTNPSKNLPDTLREKLATLLHEEGGLTREYQNLAVGAADGSRPQSDADKAHAALVRHREMIHRTELALEGILQRDAQAQSDLERGEAKTAWKHLIEASQARASIAKKLDAKLQEAAGIYASLRGAVSEVHRLTPPNFTSQHAAAFGIEGGLLESLTKITYTTTGLPGGPTLLGENAENLSQRYADSTKCIEQLRDTLFETEGNA
jgi:hypothetical protein